MPRWILPLLLITSLTLLAANLLYRPQAKPVHYHAGFRIYLNGQLQDYSDARYMNFVACTDHAVRKSAAEEQLEKAHLHDSVGDVVHVHRQGAVWGDLFRNLGVVIPAGTSVRGFLDGKMIASPLSRPIIADQSYILIVGDSPATPPDQPIPQAHIQAIAARSELCGT